MVYWSGRRSGVVFPNREPQNKIYVTLSSLVMKVYVHVNCICLCACAVLKKKKKMNKTT